MMNSKLNIYRKEWLEVVFAGRNQAYGAYELRKISNKATNLSLVVLLLTISILLISKGVYDRYFKDTTPVVEQKVTEIDFDKLIEMEDKVKEKEKIEEPIPVEKNAPQQVAMDVPKEDQIRFVEPKVAPKSQVTEDVVTQDELNKSNKMSSRLSLVGSATGTSVARGEFGPRKQDGGITGVETGKIVSGGDDALDFRSIEVQPLPIGGLPAFMKWVGENYRYPDAALQQGVNGVVEVSFVVEKDGSLTDIVVKRDVSFGTGKAAIELLSKAKKWKPGIQNGRPVRVAYTLPIRLNTISQ